MMNGLRYLGDVSTLQMNEDVCSGCGMCETGPFARTRSLPWRTGRRESSTEICAWSAGRAPRIARLVPFR
jgi:hypothetical protein